MYFDTLSYDHVVSGAQSVVHEKDLADSIASSSFKFLRDFEIH